MVCLHDKFEKLKAFGIYFHRLTFDDLLIEVGLAVEEKRKILVCAPNLHAAFLAKCDTLFSSILKSADINYADGMPIVIWRNLLWGDAHRKHRFTLSQEMPKLLDFLSKKQLKVFFLGSRQEVLLDGVANLRIANPNLLIDGHHGFFNKLSGSDENKRIMEIVNSFAPDVLVVGFGMPLQEKWIAENRAALNASVVFAAGAALEYFSGHVSRPPAVFSRWGLEWAYRLVTQPRKLWYRYLVEPIYLLPIMCGELIDSFRR